MSWTRRRFLERAAAGAAAYGLAACRVVPPERTRRALSPGDKLRLGVIGVGNRGYENLLAVKSEEIVAICDVDEVFLEKAGREFPGAGQYWDFGLMIANEDLDAVVVSTADHTHAAAAAFAMRNTMDVYCEKPLAHDVREARSLTELARAKGAVTQMGIQIHAGENYRRVVERVRSGALGEIREVHCFVNGSSWSAQGVPAEEETRPSTFHYALWLGPVSDRPYHAAYHPKGWRRYWAFGNGTIGDMACHHLDLPFWALDLTAPATIQAEGPSVDSHGCPEGMRVRYEFPESGTRPPVTLTWHDGNLRPEILTKLGLESWTAGTLFLGSKGYLISNYDRHELGPADAWKDVPPPPATLAPSPGHHREWIEACKTRGKTSCGFEYSGPLTEAVLLGTVAYRSGRKLEWDAARCEIKNLPGADKWLAQPRDRGFDL